MRRTAKPGSYKHCCTLRITDSVQGIGKKETLETTEAVADILQKSLRGSWWAECEPWHQRSTASWDVTTGPQPVDQWKGLSLLSSALFKPPKYHVQLWPLQYKKNMDKLEQVQQKAMGRLGFEALAQEGWRTRTCSAWIKDCFGGTVERSAAPSHHHLWGKVIKKMEKGSSQQCMARGQETTGVNLNKRDSNLFPMRTVKQWNTLSREVGWSPSLEFFKTEAHKALSNLNWPHSWLFWAGSWAKDLLNYATIHVTWLTTKVTFPVFQIFP